MWKNIKERLDKINWGIVDGVVIAFAAITLICNLIPLPYKCLNDTLCVIAGAIGAGYMVVLSVIFIWNRPKFDWHLVNGNYLPKVAALVLLFPSVVTTAFLPGYSPQDLVYEEGVYSPDKVEPVVSECCENVVCPPDNGATDAPQKVAPSLYWTVYFHFIDPGNQHMAVSPSGRGLSALIALFGVFLLNGLLVSAIVGWVDSRKEKWLKGEVRYGSFLCRNRHCVIVGGCDVVAGIVSQIAENKQYILIQTSNDIEQFRRRLFSNLTCEQQKRIIIYYGNRDSDKDIDELHMENADEVYIIGEDIRTDDVESYHDTMNMKCLKLISDNIQSVATFNTDNKLLCRVMFEYQTSFNILQVTDIDGDKIDFRPFNYYETWAQNVLICQELKDKNRCEYLPLEGFDGITAHQDDFVHLIVVGMSRMGLAMAIEAAHLAHYPNFETNKKRTRITFIDASMQQEKHFFMGRFKEMFAVARHRDVTEATKDIYSDVETYPWHNPLDDANSRSPYGKYLGDDFVDVEWEFLNGSIEHPHIQQYVADASANSNARLTIAICLPENSRAIAAASYLPDCVYKSDSTLQVLVYQRMNDDLLRQINQNKRYYSKLKAFGKTSMCYNTDLVKLSESIGKEVNRAYDQCAWENVMLRYRGKGLIDDDYDYLSGNLYSDSKTDDAGKVAIKTRCNEWMNNKGNCYAEVEAALKAFKGSLKSDFGEERNNPKEEAGKSKMAKMWSNKYNVYSMWTKFRCMRTGTDGKGTFNPEVDNFEPAMLEQLGKLEHNRWVVEQLLLRYRPLKEDEQQKAQLTDLYCSAQTKNQYKKVFAHLDICSNERLAHIDYNIHVFDEKLTAVLPEAYRAYLDRTNQETRV